jgi:DnaK suppressor protein
MDFRPYEQRLREIESRLMTRLADESGRAREHVADSAGDAGDISVVDEMKSTDLTEAELDAAMLRQVRAALRRIEDGTFGRCLVDGGPIETKRLDAVPWTPYCLRHQSMQEPASRPPTL